MIEFKSIHLASLQNAAHMEFVNSVTAEVKKLTTLATVDSSRKAAERLNKARDTEDENFRLTQKSDFSDSITAADKERDTKYSALKKVVDAYRKFPDTALSEAAKKLWEVIKLYKISVNMRLDNETALIDNLVQDFENKYMPEISTLNLTTIMIDMKNANNVVRDLVASRTEESASRVAGAMKVARAESDSAIKETLFAISAMAFIFDEEPYLEFAKRYNVLVDRYKKQISSGKQPKDEDE